jgi:hypothetical protein
LAEYLIDPLGSAATSPDLLKSEKIARFQDLNAGWTPFDASPEVRLMADQAVDDSIILSVASQVATAIFRYYGQSVVNVQPQAATYAQADMTFTLTASGFTVPAGLRVSIDPGDGGAGVEFRVVQDTLADDTTPTVQVQATNPGLAGSGIPSGSAVTIVDQRTWITSAHLDTETTGGLDAEEDGDYLNRLVGVLQRLSDTIVTVEDAEEALPTVAGISRVLVLDNYVPASDAPGLRYDGAAPTGSEQTGVAGAVSFVAIASDGSDVPSGVKDAGVALLAADRLAGLSVYAFDPTRTDVTVTFEYIPAPGYDEAATTADGEAAITAALDDAVWGATNSEAGPGWEEADTVYYADLYAALKIPGILHVTELTINGNADTNLTLTGPGALPNLVSVTGTVAS